MRKHTFGKCLSSALAFAVAFTTVIPGNAVITAKAGEVKQLTFGFTVDGESYTPDPADPWAAVDIVEYVAASDAEYSEVNNLKPYVAGTDMPEGTYLLDNGSYVPVSGKYVEANKSNYKTIALTQFVGVDEVSDPAAEGQIAEWAVNTTYYTVDDSGVYSPVDQSNLQKPVADATYYTISAENLDVTGYVESYVGDSVYGYYTKSGEGEDAVYTPCGADDVCQSGVTYYSYMPGSAEQKNADIYRTLPVVPAKENNTGEWTFTDPDDTGTDVTYDSETRELFIDGEWLSRNKAASGWDLAFTAVYTQLACDVTFELTGVAGLDYQIITGSGDDAVVGAVTALDTTAKKIENVPIGATLRIVDVEAADFYEYKSVETNGYITGYTGLTVQKGINNVPLTAETKDNDAYYDITVDTDSNIVVTVDEKDYAKKDVTITDTTANKSVKTVEYYQLKQDNTGAWVRKGSLASATLSNGAVTLSNEIEVGNKLEIVGFTYNTDAYEVVKAVGEQLGEAENPTALVADANGVFTTSAISEGAVITLTTTKLAQDEESGFVIEPINKGGQPVTPTFGGYEGSLVSVPTTVDEQTVTTNYIKAEGGFEFTLTPKEAYAVTKVEYEINGSTTAKEAVKLIDESTQAVSYKVPQADVQKAIVAGGATIIATLDEAAYTVKVTKLAGATAKYTEYIVTTDDSTGKPKYTAVNGKTDQNITLTDNAASIGVATGHVIGIKVIANSADNGTIITANSVKNNGTAVAPVPGQDAEDPDNGYIAGLEGLYMVDAATNALTIEAFAPVNVSVVEATKTQTTKTWTATNLTAGSTADVTDASKQVVTGAAITFTSVLGSNAARDGVADYYATVAAPTVKRGKDKAIAATYKEDGTYTISKADVEAAIEAGEPITITAAATEKTINTVKVSVAKGMTGFTYKEYSSDGKLVLSHEMNSSPSGGDKWTGRTNASDAYGVGEFQAGNRVVITGVDPYTSATTFIKVTSGNSEIAEGYTVNQNGVKTYNGTFDLGYIGSGAEYAISTATLASSAITYSGDTDNSKKAYITGNVATDSVSGGYIKNSSDATIELAMTNTDTVNDYQIATPVTYTVTKDKTTITSGQLDAVSANRNNYTLPREALKTAAVNGGQITITANLKAVGYKTQAITVKENTGATVTITSNDADVLKNGIAEVTYNQSAKIAVTGKPGYTLQAVSYVSAEKAEAKKSELNDDAAYLKWLKEESSYVKVVTAKNNAATFTISKVTEPLYLYAFTEESYSLVIGGEEAVDGQSFTRAYNEGALTISVVKGTQSQILGSSNATVNATAGDDDVKDAVFATIASNATSLTFNTANAKKTYGKTVSVKIEQLVSGNATPAFSYTVKFAVSEPLTTDIVDFTSNKDIVLPLGTKKTIALTTAKKGFDKDAYVAESVPAGLTIEKSKDGKSLTISANPDTITAPADYTVKLYDTYGAEITTSGVKVSVNTNQVTQALLKDEITAVADTDSITFDLSKVSADPEGYYDKSTEGLYYLINATAANAVTGFSNIVNVLVPASAKSYTHTVATEAAIVSNANPVKYTATVQLVQLRNCDKTKAYNDTTNNKNLPIAYSAEIFEDKTLETIIDSIFATRLTFTKSAAAPKKIYSTMKTSQAFVLGTINFPDVAKNTPVTAQRITKVELLNSAGEDVNNDHVWMEGKDVVLNVKYDQNDGLPAGKYNIVAYALEPKGKEVTCKIPVTIVQGITGLEISAPGKLYKAPGKAAKITAKVAYYPTTKPVPATKKVTWGLYTDAAATSALNVAGVTIKNGTVTLASNVVIPNEGLSFYVGATAADYAGHDLTQTALVKVYSEKMNADGFTLTIGDTELINGNSYYSSDITGEFTLYDAGYNEIEGVKYSVAGITTYKNASGNIYAATATKIAKAVTITAALTDGSGVKKTVKISVKSDENLDYDLYNADEVNDTTYTNNYDANTTLYLHIRGENGSQIDHSVTFNGFKKTKTNSQVNGTWYLITPTKNTATITIVDKTKGNAKTVLNVTNTKLAATTVKTSTKVTASNVYETGYNAKTGTAITKDAKGRIFSHLEYENAVDYEAAGSFNKVTYTVTDGKTPLKNKKVYINTATDTAEKRAFAAALGGASQTITLDEKGQFVVDYTNDGDDDGEFNLKKGTYSFTVTPVNDEGEAVAKPVVVKVVAAPAPKASVVMTTTNFTKFSSEATIGFKTMNNIVFTDTDKVENGATSAKFTGNLLGINTKGKINKFASVFDVDDGGNKLTCVQAPKGYDEAYTAKPSAGMQGWIEYQWTNLDGSIGKTYVKVTVKPASGSDIIKK